MSKKNHINLREPVGIVRGVTLHALKRWRERTHVRSQARALATLVKHLVPAVEVQLAPKYQEIALLNHGLKPARYLRFNIWVFVVSMDGALLTVYKGSTKRWILPGPSLLRLES